MLLEGLMGIDLRDVNRLEVSEALQIVTEEATAVAKAPFLDMLNYWIRPAVGGVIY